MRTLKMVLCWVVMAGALYGTEAGWEEHVRQGDSFLKQSQPKEALKEFQEADRLHPHDSAILARISESFSDLLDEEKTERIALQCVEYASQAVKADPASSRAHVDLAIAYGKLT